ncbi:MAG: DUF2892 domain-containing protein [Gammaproteobacteria bacterium]|nr:DUF2892 domain-containing protein [Gammaproteobacteria bacterium]
MKRNVSNLDRTVRIIVGVACCYFVLFPTPVLTNEVLLIFLGSFGLLNLYSAVFSYCPIYAMADISTYRQPQDES